MKYLKAKWYHYVFLFLTKFWCDGTTSLIFQWATLCHMLYIFVIAPRLGRVLVPVKKRGKKLNKNFERIGQWLEFLTHAAAGAAGAGAAAAAVLQYYTNYYFASKFLIIKQTIGCRNNASLFKTNNLSPTSNLILNDD